MGYPRISLILPAYNEARVIQSTVRECASYFEQRGLEYEIIVSADGDDGTRELVREMAVSNPRLKAIGENSRRGKGRGIREAVHIARGEIIGYADADNKVPIQEFAKIESCLAQGYQVALGSRALSESKIERTQPLYRQLGSKGFGIFMHSVIGLHGIRDTQCGFKFFPGEVAKFLFRHQVIDGYMFDVEILYIAERSQLRMIEVPVRWRDDGDSRLNVFSGNLKNAKDIFRIRLQRRALEPTAQLSCSRVSRSVD